MSRIDISGSALDALTKQNEPFWNSFRQPRAPDDYFFIASYDFFERDWSGWDLSRVHFESCSFKKCNFHKANLKSARFQSNCTIDECDLTEIERGAAAPNTHATYFEGMKAINSKLENLNSGYTVFSSASFDRCSFHSSDLSHNSMQHCTFTKCDFRDCEMKSISISGGIRWDESIFNGKTNLEDPHFDNHYPLDNDRSETIRIDWKDWPTWKWIHFLSKIPVFQASFSTFIIALFIANIIATLNHTQYILDLDYPIPTPRQLILLLISTGCLFIGALLYRFGCPENVQNFSSSEWVVEHKKPRPVYTLLTLKNLCIRRFCMLFLLGGAIIGCWLITCRILDVTLGLDHKCLYCHTMEKTSAPAIRLLKESAQ